MGAATVAASFGAGVLADHTPPRGMNPAVEIGLVDELAPTPAEVAPRAIEWCRQHLEFPSKALKATRDLARADLHALFGVDNGASGELFIDLWFSDSTQEKLQRLVAGLKKS